MQYLCLCHYSLKNFGSFGPAEFEEIGRICEPHDAELKASGNVRLIGSLAMPDAFRTLRANRDGSIDVSEGPYASTDEPFGAFLIVEANSMDEAERIARLHPGTHLGHLMAGGIEIRPIEQLERL